MTDRTVSIDTEYIKLDQFLKLCGAAPSGGTAKEDILSGRVEVNGEVCLMRGRKLYPGDRVTFDGHTAEVRGNDGG